MFEFLKKKQKKPPTGGGGFGGDKENEEKIEAPDAGEALDDLDKALREADALKAEGEYEARQAADRERAQRELRDVERELRRMLERERNSGGGGRCGC